MEGDVLIASGDNPRFEVGGLVLDAVEWWVVRVVERPNSERFGEPMLEKDSGLVLVGVQNDRAFRILEVEVGV